MSEGEDGMSSHSSAEESMTSDDLIGDVKEEDHAGEGLESDFRDALDRLDSMKLDADLDMSELPTDPEESSKSPDTNSLGNGSLNSVGQDSVKSSSSKESGGSPRDTDIHSKDSKDSVKHKFVDKGAFSKQRGQGRGASVLAKLKKLTKSDKGSRKSKSKDSEFKEVKVEKLPQVFVAKYLGKRDARGVSGLQNVRRPVDKLVGAVREQLEDKDAIELPLVYVVISTKGIDIREHKSNQVKDVVTNGLIPIDFISYGVQDMKYWRVFTFIVIKELSSRAKSTECHAILCDSTDNARKMALSLGAAFNLYGKKLRTEGKSHNFRVELRAPDELAEEYSKDEEC